jgi:hypothetical protein
MLSAASGAIHPPATAFELQCSMMDPSLQMRIHRVLSIAVVAFLTLLLGLIATSAHNARAQSTLEVPGPAQQNQPYVPPRQAPPPQWNSPAASDHGNGNTIQLLPPEWFTPQAQSAAPQSPPPRPNPAPSYMSPMASQSNPVLPSTFRGCWQGQVNQLDWIRREPGAHKVGFWTPKTYRLCYKRIGDRPFTLTFTETGIEPNEKIINPHGNVVPIKTDGRAYAAMRAQLHFDEYSSGWNPVSNTFAVDETTHLNCQIAGNDMTVTADVYGTRDGEPWFRAHWRADFRHYAE